MKSLLKKILVVFLAIFILWGVTSHAEEVNLADVKDASLGIIIYLQENGLASFSGETNVKSVEPYLNQKGHKLNVIFFEPKGYLVLSSDYNHDVIIDFSDNEWGGNYDYLDCFNVLDNKPDVYREKWKLFIQEGLSSSFQIQKRRQARSDIEQRLLTTINWNQRGTMNSNSVDYSSAMPTVQNMTKNPNGRAFAGCVAVAMGIVMNYHSFPPHSPVSRTEYNWSGSVFDASLATLLKELNEVGNGSYGLDGTGMNKPDMLNTLKQFGYAIESSDSHTASGMYSFSKNHIDNDNPLLLWGRRWTSDILGLSPGWDDSRGYNHTVVVNGYKKVSSWIDDDYYLYINYGWGGNGDRWWKIDSLADWVWGDRLDTKSLDVAIPLSIRNLSSGVSVSDSVSDGEWKYYQIDTTSSYSEVKFELTNLSDDVDLYVRYNSIPTKDGYDCRPWKSGTTSEECNPQYSTPATWYVGVYGYEAGSFKIKATLSSPSGNDDETRWNGNGSIVSYSSGSDTGFGFTHDMTRIHASSDKPVVFFQWEVDSGDGKKLEIYTDSSSSSVNKATITYGQWNTRNNDVAYQNVNLPFIIDPENDGFSANDGSWYVVKVAFSNTLSSGYENVRAKATSDAASSGNPVSIIPNLVDGYEWHGNASVVSYSSGNDTGFGFTHDMTRIHASSDKPVVFFQWEVDSGDGKKLEIYTDSSSSSVNKATITYGQWNTRNNDVAYQNVNLPFIIDPENDGFSANDGSWYVVKVAFSNTLSSGYENVRARATD